MKGRKSGRAILIGLLGLGIWLATFVVPAAVQADSNHWRGEYYNNTSLHGSPVLVRNDHDVDFDWGHNAPDHKVNADHFSVRWTRDLRLDADRYRFTVAADDGVRLWVDGKLVIDEWHDGARDEHSATVKVKPGMHTVRLEYYEHAGEAAARLAWEETEGGATPIGNIITCVRPSDSWIKVYRLESSGWVDVNPAGYGPLSPQGNLKLDGMLVDSGRYGEAGHPYRVELWASGSRIRAVGDTSAGQPEFRVRAGGDSVTPWSCPAP